jgi:toxin ParE1/3/4
VTRIELAPEISEDFERILEHLNKYEMVDAEARIEEIVEGISALKHNPMIGRIMGDDLKELIIGRHSHGYVALYRYIPEIEIVFVLAIRSQREAGYKT